MTTDADDALIAKLLAEDNAYGDPYYRDFDEYHSDDSEHGRSKRRKKTIKRGDLLSHMRSMVFQQFQREARVAAHILISPQAPRRPLSRPTNP